MRLIRGAVLLSAAAVMAFAADAPPVIRPAPDYKIRFVDGTQVPLSSFRGKVVALLGVFTTCPHCQHASEVFTRLASEYGSRGFQPIDVAFNSMANLYVRDFVNEHHISYPVGFDTPENVLGFLGYSVMERYVVPQIVWIGRNGNIRSQTPPNGDEKLLNEAYWRQMIETLTKEPVSAPAHKTTSTHHTTSAKKTP
ncbi:MAG: TlpA family protein disulfide reductase [Acidobacteriia bacterium]|nr:TlpA family protein disulfide reductase [Terriglobia bacterium]